jgi:hypothetical protein
MTQIDLEIEDADMIVERVIAEQSIFEPVFERLVLSVKDFEVALNSESTSLAAEISDDVLDASDSRDVDMI